MPYNSLIDMIRQTGSVAPDLTEPAADEVLLPMPNQLVEVQWLVQVHPLKFEPRRAIVSVLHLEREPAACYVDVLLDGGGQARITDLSQIRPLPEWA